MYKFRKEEIIEFLITKDIFKLIIDTLHNDFTFYHGVHLLHLI
jgi:hypothetical protein